jgi:glucoside 3-dehydrogenase (cytochrome c) hitch-hiker subunit
MTDKPPSATITRRTLLQKACFAGALVSIAPLLAEAQSPTDGLTPAQQGIDASGEFANPNWKPLFFSDEQNRTVAALCDVMIPATDTPGAKQAMVNRYADLVLSAESPQAQGAFVTALQHIDDESVRGYGKPFRALSADEQVEVLIPMAFPMPEPLTIAGTQAISSYQHFARVKALIVEGYYSSETGDNDLGWDGAFSHGRYEGCESRENDENEKK